MKFVKIIKLVKIEGWQCNQLPACGIQNYTECDAAQNCERFLCPGGNNNVCCKSLNK